MAKSSCLVNDLTTPHVSCCASFALAGIGCGQSPARFSQCGSVSSLSSVAPYTGSFSYGERASPMRVQDVSCPIFRDNPMLGASSAAPEQQVPEHSLLPVRTPMPVAGNIDTFYTPQSVFPGSRATPATANARFYTPAGTVSKQVSAAHQTIQKLASTLHGFSKLSTLLS